MSCFLLTIFFCLHMLSTKFNFSLLVVDLRTQNWKLKSENKKLELQSELGFKTKMNKIQKFKFNIKSKHNFTQIGPGLRPYLGKIVMLSFQNLFYFHIDVLLTNQDIIRKIYPQLAPLLFSFLWNSPMIQMIKKMLKILQSVSKLKLGEHLTKFNLIWKLYVRNTVTY